MKFPDSVTWACGLLTALLSISAHSIAQPILGSSDLPQGGQTYMRANAVPPLIFDIESSGADLTWDFSDLASAGEVGTEYLPMSAASLTTQFVFSSADHFTEFDFPDLGLEDALPISGASTYLEFGSNAYKVIGLGLATDVFDLPVIYEDDEELLPLPLTYGAQLEGTSAFELDIPELLFYGTSQSNSIEVDAWGTLLLPGGAYECLRVKRTFSALDSVNVPTAQIGFTIPREGTVYEWYAAGEGMPVLSVQTFADIPAVWQFKPGEEEPSNIAQAEGIGVSLRPAVNPAETGSALEMLTDEGGMHMCTVHDAAGQCLFNGILKATSGRITLPSAGWPAGCYFVSWASAVPVRVTLR